MESRRLRRPYSHAVAAQRRPDPALGVFDTLLVREHRAQALERHLERLGTAVAALYGEQLPANLAERVRSAAAELVAPHRVRIDAVPESGGLAFSLAATPASLGDPTQLVTLRPVVVPGGIGEYKWRDRRLIDELASDGSIPLILDAGDEVLEAGQMNVWVVEGRRILTPPADGRLLPGVTRALVLELAPALELEAAEEPITLARAQSADSIFVTSSIRRAATATLEGRSGPAPDTATATMLLAALDAVAWT